MEHLDKDNFISLTNFNLKTMVDKEDYEKFSRYRWRMNKNGYVMSSFWEEGKVKTKTLHRLIMEAPKGFDVDHIDHNRLNNMKSNLRLTTRSENMMNMGAKVNKVGHSKYKGVSYLNREKLKNKWTAFLKKDYVMYNLGYFATEEEAALAYDCAAIQLFGDFASLNLL